MDKQHTAKKINNEALKKYTAKKINNEALLVVTPEALKKISKSFDKSREHSMKRTTKETMIDFVEVK